MAQRDLDTRNTITNVVAKNVSALGTEMADMGEKIIQQSQEAKITENLSKAQLDINALDNQFRIDSQGNPFDPAAMENYKTQRKQIVDRYGNEVSPVFRQQWRQSMRSVEGRSDISTQAWQYKQAKVNTITSINSSIENNLSSAAESGRLYASGETGDLESFLSYEPARNQLTAFAASNLGETEAGELLKNYDEDYMKSFLSGVAEANPVKALQLMDNEVIKASAGDSETFNKFKQSIESRALKFSQIEENKLVLNSLRNDNDLLSKSSLTNPISYATLQKEFSKRGTPDEVQEFFLRANGYSSAEVKALKGGGDGQTVLRATGITALDSGGKLSASERENVKADIYDSIVQMGRNDNLSTADVEQMQNIIYRGMDKGALSKKEGTDFINSLVGPLIDRKEDSLGQFEDKGGWWNPWDNVGFTQVKDYFDKEVAIPAAEGDKEVGQLTQRVNNARKLQLYQGYEAALKEQADARGIDVMGISDLPANERREVINNAMNEAKRTMVNNSFSVSRVLEDAPNAVLTKEGKLVPVKSGESKVKPDIKVTDTRAAVEVDAKGNRARVYRQGGAVVKYEELGKDGTVLRTVIVGSD